VFARQRPEVEPVLDGRAHELAIPVSRTSEWARAEVELHARGSRFTLSGKQALCIACPLAGEHQVENASTAALALLETGVATRAIEEGIARTVWPGRLERVSEKPEILIDGAHNPAGARSLARYLEQFYRGRRVVLIYGAMRDKAVEEVCGILFPLAQEVIATAPDQPRALHPQAIVELNDHPNMRTAASLGEALELVRDAGSEDLVMITGSLYLVGEARARFHLRP